MILFSINMDASNSEFITVACHSERGRRYQNEDVFALPAALLDQAATTRILPILPSDNTALENKGYLFVVADGVAGKRGGEVASHKVVEEVAKRYYDDPSIDIATSLQRVIEASNRMLRRLQSENYSLRQMATTVVCVVVKGEKVLIANVGDSRVYCLRKERLDLLTTDHSWIQEQSNLNLWAGSKEQEQTHRHLLTRCLGRHDQVGVDLRETTVGTGDRLLLCTDGLSSVLTESELFLLGKHKPLKSAASTLINTAFDKGSTDNITAILIEVRISSA